jgi:hypothetical protein
MAFLPKQLVSTQQRWRDVPLSACFSWPSDEVTTVINQTGLIGDIVYTEEKLSNWRYKVAHGLNATTLLDAETSTLEYNPGFLLLGKWCVSAQAFGWLQYDGDLFVGHTTPWSRPPAATSVIDPKTRDEALGRAISDARGKQSHFRGGNFLAELTDTIRGLRNPAKGFRDLLGTYHRNARKRVKRAVGRRALPVTQHDFRRLEKDAPEIGTAAQRALSDTWLEHNFGWAPLLSDAVDAYKAIRALSARTPLARFYGTSSNSGTPTYASGIRNHDVTPLEFTVRTVEAYDVTFYGAVKVEVDSPPSGQAIEEMGVQAQDFVPAVWEAIPYSFLIDYFSNVGSVIEAVSFPRSDLAWVARTYRNHSIRSTERVAIGVISPAFPATNSNKVFGFRPPRVQWTRTRVNRAQYTGSLVPRLRLEIPGSKNWRKWLNIAALARMRTL